MKLKRTLTAIIAIVMILCTALSASAHPFTDFQASHWAQRYINWAYNQGLMNGISSNAFEPETATSRAMLVTVLWRYEGEPAATTEVPFTDLNGAWYEHAVAWAYANNIVNGTSATTYEPDRSITRQELATIFYRYAEAKAMDTNADNVDLSVFPDHQKVASWAEPAMRWAYDRGIVTGSADNGQIRLLPENSATRAQMAAIFYRYTDLVQNATYGKDNILKIISYNLRNANDPDGRSIQERAKRFKVVMNTYHPDVLALQEVTAAWASYLMDDYSETTYGDYQLYYMFRAANSEEATPVMWNTNVLEAVDQGVFWLSDTPDTESIATNWDAEFYRITTWVKLKVKATGKIFLFMSTHFDFSSVSHVNSVELIHQKAKELGGFTDHSVFVAGDHNFNPWGHGYNAYYITTDFADLNYELYDGDPDPTGTANGYHTQNSNDLLLDFIFYSHRTVQPLRYEVIDMTINGNYVSDKCGLYAEAALL